MKTIREEIVNLLVHIEKDKTFIQLLLKKELMGFDVKDRAFMTEIINGTVKYRLRLDHIINQFSKVPTKKMKPVVRNLMRMSVYQMFFMDKVPPSAVINEAVKIIHRRKMSNLSGFVNGVLRTIEREKEKVSYPNPVQMPLEYLEVFYSIPKWIIKMWVETYGYEITEKICISLNERPETTLRVNTLKTDIKTLAKRLEAEDVKIKKSFLLPEESLYIKGTGAIHELESFKEGLWTVQDESAMLVAHVVSPKSGEKILDMCSAPGGKTTHLAQLMNDTGEIIATDLHEHKIPIIMEHAKRLGINSIKAYCQDGTLWNANWKESFDKILLDAPCSGLGIIKRKPDIRYEKTEEDLKAIFEVQKQLAAVAKGYLKPNGILVYSTCTISPEENEKMFNYMTQKLGLEAEDVAPYVPECFRTYCNQGLQILPYVAHTDGFYIARFRKKG